MRTANMLWGNVKTPTDVKKVQELIDNTVTLLNPGTPSRYPYVAFASSDAGADFSKVFKPDLTYAAILISDTLIAWEDLDASDFAGLWFPIGSWVDGMISAKIIPIMSVDGYQSVCNCPFFLFLKGDVEMPFSKSVYSTLYNGLKGWQTIQEINAIAVNAEAHGFTSGQLVYDSGSGYALADANDIAKAATGIVINAMSWVPAEGGGITWGVNPDIFFVASMGFVPMTAAAGTRYCLSTTAGQMVDEATALAYPSGKVLQYIGIGTNNYEWHPVAGTEQIYDTAGIVLAIERGKVIGAAQNGREVELRTNAGWVEWKYEDEVTWTQLYEIPIPADGEDGREVEISTNAEYIVWRYVGETVWNNICPVPQDGAPGTPGTDGLPGADGANGHTPYIQGDNWWINGVDTGVKAAGTDGVDGRGISSIVLHSTVGKVKTYRITFTDATTFDYSVTDGNDGAPGAAGADGREIELQENAGWVEWRYVGDATWTQLYEIPEGGTPGGAEPPELHLDFGEAGLAYTYNVPYAMKFTSQVSEVGDATLSIALNTNLARYDKLTITATAAGLVSLYGEYL